MGTTISSSRRPQASTSSALISYLALFLLLSCTCSAFTPINRPNPPPPTQPSPNQPGPAEPPTQAGPSSRTLHDLFDVASGDDKGSCKDYMTELETWFDEVKEIVTLNVDFLDDYIGPQSNGEVRKALRAFSGIAVNADGTGPASPADQERFGVVKDAYVQKQRFFDGDLPQLGHPGIFCNDDWVVDTDAIHNQNTGEVMADHGYKEMFPETFHGIFDDPNNRAWYSEKYHGYYDGPKICDGNTYAETHQGNLRSITFCPKTFSEKRPMQLSKKHVPSGDALEDMVPMSFTLLHELDHLVRAPPASDDVPYWGPRSDLQPGRPDYPGPVDEFVDHSPLPAAGAGRCLFTAQSKPDLVVRNSESLAYLGLTIFLSQFGNDFSTGLARGLGAPQAAPAPGTTDPGYKVPSQQPENPPPKKRSGKGGKKPSNNPPRLKGRQTTEPSGSGRYLEIAKIRRVFQA